jgi:hypothetical protein
MRIEWIRAGARLLEITEAIAIGIGRREQALSSIDELPDVTHSITIKVDGRGRLRGQEN